MNAYNGYQFGSGMNLHPCPYMSRQFAWRPYLQTRQTFSYIRLLHASPGTPPVDIYANRSLIASGLGYRGFTEYLQMLPGRYNIQIFRAGTTGPVLLNTDIDLPVQSINTAVFIGAAPAYSMKTFFETVIRIPPGMLYLRFANLVPSSPDMDLVLSDGTKLFEDVSYGMATNYTPIAAGTYIFYLLQSGTNRRLLYVPNISLGEGRFYTIYAVGRMDGIVPLQVLIPLDGNSYISL